MEVIVVISIFGALGLITFPLVKSSIRQANIGRSSAHLRQLHVATALYMQDYDYSGFDDPKLTIGLRQLADYAKLPDELLRTRGTSLIPGVPSGDVYQWLLPDKPGENEYRTFWRVALQAAGANMPYALDLTQNDFQHGKKFRPYLVLALRQDGSVLRRRMTGTPSDPDRWR